MFINIKKFFSYILIILFFSVYIITSYKFNNFSPYKPDIKNIKIGNGSYAKIGLISDLHLAFDLEKKNDRFIHYANNLYRTFKYFKENGIDILIITGDITNNGFYKNLLYFKKIFYSIYNDNSKPIVISIMGNHDLYNLNFSESKNQIKFYKIINSYSNSLYIINNYYFILWSHDSHLNSENTISNYSWIRNSLEFSKNNLKREGDPIFIITHMPPKNTVYGSESVWGHTSMYNFLKNYHQIICLSGHSHHSLRNVKSIWQGDFTAVNMQSISYIDIDNYFENAKDVRYESGKDFESMGLIAHLTEKNIIFERVNFNTGEILEERWKIDFPINIKNFIYTFEKRNKKEKPVFHNDNIIIEEIKEKNKYKKYIIFNAAIHSDYVYIYKIVFKNINKDFEKVFYYYSDYYKNEKKREKTIKFKISKDIVSGFYKIEIYAIDSFDNISNKIEKKIFI